MPGDRAARRPSLPSPLLLLPLLLLLSRAAALRPEELFPYGESRGDQLLQKGDDESSGAVKLATPLRFYDVQFTSLFVGTNGLISTQDFPMETQYVDYDLPTDFPAIAPFLADIDTSHGRGRVLFREDTSREVLGLAAHYVRTGFPRSAATFTPTHAFLATWEQVGAYEKVSPGVLPSGELNTFQAVLAFDQSDTYALFLYPANGLRFYGTRPKESYNAQLQLPARVGFCRGETDDLKQEGPYFSMTSTEQSVKNLYQLSNLGIPGVWAFHIGSRFPLDNIRPAAVDGDRPTARASVPSENSFGQAAALESDFTDDDLDYYDENEEEIEYPPGEPKEALDDRSRVNVSFQSNADRGLLGGGISPPDSGLTSHLPHPVPSDWPSHPETESATLDPHAREGVSLGEGESPDLEGQRETVDQTEIRSPASPEVDGGPLAPSREGSPPDPGNRGIQPYPDGGAMPSKPDAPVAHPEGEVVHSSHTPALSPGRHRAGVEDSIGSNNVVSTYGAAGKETCEHNHGQCSQHAFCTDYTSGFCCHCQSRFYGNGKHCLPEGVPYRVNGKVSGNLHVGSTPVHFADVDLHAYVVGNDGRAYTAISHIPQPAAQALLPVISIGGLFGWLFALEKPGSENGFSLTGATFIHDMEVTFYPRGEKVRITQTAEGLDPENYMRIKTNIQGQVPYIPANSVVHITPYKELYHYSDSAVTSTSSREYSLIFGAINQTWSYRVQQNLTYQMCRHAPPHRAIPATQQLTVDRVFTLYSEDEDVLRFAVSNQIGPVEASEPAPVNPCYDGRHTCDRTARCHPGTGVDYTCECAPGYQGDGRSCVDINECATGFHRCGPNSMCINLLGNYRCECRSGYQFADDQHTCILIAPPANPCEDGSHTCAPAGQARCVHHGGSTFSCACLAGYTGDGHHCSDVDECTENRCHSAATCYNTPGSFSCRCQPGYHGDGFQCTPDFVPGLKPCERQQRYAQAQHAFPGSRVHIPQCDQQGNFLPLQCHGSTGFCWCVDPHGQEIPGTQTPPGSNPPPCGPPPEPTQRPPTVCERWRENLLEHYGGTPRDDQYVPQCDDLGHFVPLQCHGKSDFCWCVDKDGREVPGSRSQPGTTPACIPTVAPPTVRPLPRPDVTPPSVGTFLLYTQGQQITSLPLNGTRLRKDQAKTLLSLHGSIIVGIDYDCQERMVYWTDVAGRTISRVSLEPGAEPETIINSGVMGPEGLAIDHFRRTMYWTDSGLDRIGKAKLDGSERQVLFYTDLVNPRAIVVDPIQGNLYWTDWNREGPKIETSSLDGEGRRILVHKEIGLPNALTFDTFSKLLCWADAGTRKLECILPDGTGRRVIQNNLNYPFSLVSYTDHFYYTDWRRDGVISVNKNSGQFTDEYFPEQRSHLYGITVVHPYCPGGRK